MKDTMGKKTKIHEERGTDERERATQRGEDDTEKRGPRQRSG